MTTTSMTKRALGVVIPSLTAAMLIAGVAEAQQGAAGRAGQALDNAGKSIRRGLENAFTKTRTAVHDQEVISRVYSRLHWDKTLVGSTLEVEVRDGGVVFLRGSVPDAAAKQRAVVLARDTVGVNQVMDELAIPTTSPTAPTTKPIGPTTGVPKAENKP